MNKRDKSISPKICIYPECNLGASTRGLCRGHYSYASLLVRHGKTNWDKLESAGKALKPSRGSAHRSWFLENNQKDK